jgi:hypothetical protein
MAKLEKLGFSQETATNMISVAQEIANLQLLTPAENQSKGGRFPAEWLNSAFPSETDQGAIRALHHLGELGADLQDFDTFILQRRIRLAGLIRTNLGVPTADSLPTADDD